MSELHCAISGPSLSGKTTLARHLSESYWKIGKIRSLVLDINGEKWHDNAEVYIDEESFFKRVWATNGYAVFIDESSSTISRDREKIPLFTRIRHNYHKLHVICHAATNLLPEMREQISTAFLFNQSEKAAKIWSETLMDKRLLETENLPKYHFLHYIRYGDPENEGKNLVRKCVLRLPKKRGRPKIREKE